MVSDWLAQASICSANCGRAWDVISNTGEPRSVITEQPAWKWNKGTHNEVVSLAPMLAIAEGCRLHLPRGCGDVGALAKTVEGALGLPLRQTR